MNLKNWKKMDLSHRMRYFGNIAEKGLENPISIVLSNCIVVVPLTYHVMRFSGLVDLWVIKEKPMILCARSTSRSREQSTECRSRNENMRKVIVRITRLYDYQIWPTHFF